MRSFYGDSRVRLGSGAAYDVYEADLRAAGVQRRNDFELLEAHLQAMLKDFAPMITLARSYEKPPMPKVPPLPDDEELRVAVLEDFRSEDSLPRSETKRSQLIREGVEALRDSLVTERTALTDQVSEAYQLFENLDPAMNLIVLQTAFADNDGTAAPIHLDGNHLLVLMSYPPIADAVWPERWCPDGVKVKKTTKEQLILTYIRNLACHTSATAKEAFCVQPRLRAVSVIVIGEEPVERLSEQGVLLCARFYRDEFFQAATPVADRYIRRWDHGVSIWESGTGEPFDRTSAAISALGGVVSHFDELVEVAERTINELEDSWAFRVSDELGFSPELVLGELLPADELDSATLMSSAVATPVDNPRAFRDCLYWCEALELAAAWDDEQDEKTNPLEDDSSDPARSLMEFWDVYRDRLTNLQEADSSVIQGFTPGSKGFRIPGDREISDSEHPHVTEDPGQESELRLSRTRAGERSQKLDNASAASKIPRILIGPRTLIGRRSSQARGHISTWWAATSIREAEFHNWIKEHANQTAGLIALVAGGRWAATYIREGEDEYTFFGPFIALVVFLIARKVILSKDTREKGLRVFLGFACLLLYLILPGQTGVYLDLSSLLIYGCALLMIEGQKGRSEYFREKKEGSMSEHYRENNSPG